MLETNSDAIKTVDRDQHAMYKRKHQYRNNYKSATDEEDLQSAPSLKASSNPPLPELHKDKKKIHIKPFGILQPKNTSNIVQKQVRQHDNILLKQKNNLLSSQNMKLKTKITILQRQNQRLQKAIQQEGSNIKPHTSYNNYREKIKSNDNSVRNIIRGLRKQIQDLKKENTNIKSTIKFTSLKELEVERDHLAEQTIRLRIALEDEQSRRVSLKNSHQGVSVLEHKVHYYSQKNSQLTRQIRQLHDKCKRIEQNTSKSQRAIEHDKKNVKTLQNALAQIKQKDEEIQHLKSQLKTCQSIPSINNITTSTPKQNKFDIRRQSLDKKGKNAAPVKPAQTKANQFSHNQQKYAKLEQENKMLLDKIKKLQSQMQKGGNKSFGELPTGPISQVKQNQVQELARFMTLRFKAHRLSYQQSQKYLINCQSQMNQQQMNKTITVKQLMQSLFVEPFCIISNRYIQVLVAKLAYPGHKAPITINESEQLRKGSIISQYKKLIPQYTIQNQQKQEQMFIQVAQLITTYYQQILTALTTKKNGEGTISEQHFLQFFKEIELEQEYIDFIITQIILQSLDMNHLNFFAMFQIFYMPQMNQNSNQKKKKFQLQQEEIVHEEDQEYEESKSHLGSRNKTLQHKDKQEQDYEWEQQSPQKSPKLSANLSKSNQIAPKRAQSPKQEQEYIQQFQGKQGQVQQQLPS